MRQYLELRTFAVIVRNNTNEIRFWGVFWVDCATQSTIEQTFLQYARSCGQTVDGLDDALAWLARIKHHWLLIVDNADDPEVDYAE